MKPNFNLEKELWKKNFLVIGVDEVGRGAFAGPLVLSGVIFKPPFYASIPPQRERSFHKYITFLESLGINDSKKLSEQKRKLLAPLIKKHAFHHITVSISVSTINKVGIGKATQMGVRKLVSRIMYKVYSKKTRALYPILYTQYFLLMDGFYIKYVKGIGLKNQKGIIRGDSISLSIAAASIIAKVHRDTHMISLAKKFPQYKWDENKGYGTKLHREVLKRLGKTEIHRDVFIATTLKR